MLPHRLLMNYFSFPKCIFALKIEKCRIGVNFGVNSTGCLRSMWICCLVTGVKGYLYDTIQMTFLFSSLVTQDYPMPLATQSAVIGEYCVLSWTLLFSLSSSYYVDEDTWTTFKGYVHNDGILNTSKMLTILWENVPCHCQADICP